MFQRTRRDVDSFRSRRSKKPPRFTQSLKYGLIDSAFIDDLLDLLQGGKVVGDVVWVGFGDVGRGRDLEVFHQNIQREMGVDGARGGRALVKEALQAERKR